MCVRSTLDCSQSNNIYCFLHNLHIFYCSGKYTEFEVFLVHTVGRCHLIVIIVASLFLIFCISQLLYCH